MFKTFDVDSVSERKSLIITIPPLQHLPPVIPPPCLYSTVDHMLSMLMILKECICDGCMYVQPFQSFIHIPGVTLYNIKQLKYIVEVTPTIAGGLGLAPAAVYASISLRMKTTLPLNPAMKRMLLLLGSWYTSLALLHGCMLTDKHVSCDFSSCH